MQATISLATLIIIKYMKLCTPFTNVQYRKAGFIFEYRMFILKYNFFPETEHSSTLSELPTTRPSTPQPVDQGHMQMDSLPTGLASFHTHNIRTRSCITVLKSTRFVPVRLS